MHMCWTVLCPFISPAVFAQYEDHLSVYDWCPDQTLWDWLPVVASAGYPLNPLQRSAVWDSGSLPRRLSSWHNPVYWGCSPLSQSEAWKQANETITSVRHQYSALKALRVFEHRPPQDCCWCCCDVRILCCSRVSICTSQIKSSLTDWIKNVFCFFPLLWRPTRTWSSVWSVCWGEVGWMKVTHRSFIMVFWLFCKPWLLTFELFLLVTYKIKNSDF